MQQTISRKRSLLWVAVTALLIIAVTWWLASKNHSTNKETLLAFKRVDSSLTAANQVLVYSNNIISDRWKELSKKPELSAIAAIWSPMLDSAIARANRMVEQIETLKLALKNEAGLRMDDGEDFFHEDDPGAVRRLMIKKGEGEKLKTALIAFKQDLVTIIPEQKRNHLPKLPVQTLLAYQPSHNGWTEAWFENISTVAALTLFNKMQNDVLRSGNIVAEYCGSQVCIIEVIYDKFETLISQNSTYLSNRDTLVIKAGIGTFSEAARPTIIFGGSKIAINENGVAVYKVVVSGVGGEVPVSISFRNPDTGEMVTKTTFVSYKVAPPK